MLVALYLRRTIDEVLQAGALDAQNDILRAYAKSSGHEVIAVYPDGASGVRLQVFIV